MAKALGTFCLGLHGEIHAGQEVPATFEDIVGDTHPTDFDRLVELGLISKAPAAPKPKPDEKAKGDAKSAA